jgi:hypothetical protein
MKGYSKIVFITPDLSPPQSDIVLKKKGKKIVVEETNQSKLISDINKYKPKIK